MCVTYFLRPSCFSLLSYLPLKKYCIFNIAHTCLWSAFCLCGMTIFCWQQELTLWQFRLHVAHLLSLQCCHRWLLWLQGLLLCLVSSCSCRVHFFGLCSCKQCLAPFHGNFPCVPLQPAALQEEQESSLIHFRKLVKK